MKGYCYPGAEVRRLISWDDYTNVPQANHQISSTGQSNRILCTLVWYQGTSPPDNRPVFGKMIKLLIIKTDTLKVPGRDYDQLKLYYGYRYVPQSVGLALLCLR
jgi:hypothetical protein